MHPSENMIGAESGLLKAVREVTRSVRRGKHWYCECQCEGKTGFPGFKVVCTSDLKRKRIKHCGCKRKRRDYSKHNRSVHINRDCREGVMLALHLAKLTGEDHVVMWSVGLAYGVKLAGTTPGSSLRVLYQVNQQGRVEAKSGYPTYRELFGCDWISFEWCRPACGPDWVLSKERFRPHEKNLAEDRVQELQAREPGRYFCRLVEVNDGEAE